MLFILIRYTRLLQFHKESGLAEDESLSASSITPSATKASKLKGSLGGKILVRSSMAWSGRDTMLSGTFLSEPAETEKNFDSPASRGKGK